MEISGRTEPGSKAAGFLPAAETLRCYRLISWTLNNTPTSCWSLDRKEEVAGWFRWPSIFKWLVSAEMLQNVKYNLDTGERLWVQTLRLVKSRDSLNSVISKYQCRKHSAASSSADAEFTGSNVSSFTDEHELWGTCWVKCFCSWSLDLDKDCLWGNNHCSPGGFFLLMPLFC